MPRLYHFHFDGITEPVTIQADTSERARAILSDIKEKLPSPYHGKAVVEETTESLVTGVTTKNMGGKKCIWTGKDWKPIV